MGLFPSTKEGEKKNRCLPVVTEEDIRDRSKSDEFTKAFAFIQCAWLVTQCSTRAAVGLPLTELELMTLAFIVAALVMYGFWWHKPFDVQRATMLLCPDEKASKIRSRLRGNLERRKQWRQKNTISGNLFFYMASVVENNATGSGSLMFATVGTVISGLHIVAWSWDFPSNTIRILWRVFSVAATCCVAAPYQLLVAYGYIVDSPDTMNSFGLFTLVSLMTTFSTIYIISRLGLIFLVFYCFSSMSAAVYETVNWNTILPHFS